MKSMCKHWGLHISTDIDCLEVFLGSFWAVWRGLLWCLKTKLRSWRFPRYWRFNKRYHGGYQLICLISRPILIASRRDWYLSKGILKGFKLALRPWESSKNWWRYGRMKFVTEPISTRGSILVCITFPSFLASPVCKGISRVVLSKFWGSVLLMASNRLYIALPLFLTSSVYVMQYDAYY